jgi:geranylgeranyl reductase family protein
MDVNAQFQRWDAIVVGAGPAGCAAAYDLAAAGRSVVLLDKSVFPRHKACAGGLTSKAVKTLRYSIAPVVRETISSMRLEDGERNTTLKSREPICVMTVRAELDQYCLEQTIKAGADLRRISAIREIVASADGVDLRTDEGLFCGRFLIGADGANGQVRRLAEQGSWFSQAFAIEVQTPMGPDRELVFDFAPVADGYGWVFPKRDHLNIGLYSRLSSSGLNKSGLAEYVAARVGVEKLEHVTGQYLGLGAGSSEQEFVRPELRDRVMLVGDAGGFADALTGEGIYGALHSGQAAARAILTVGDGPVAEAFARGVEKYRRTLRFSDRAAKAFYADTARGFRAMRLPFVRRTMVRTYTHGLNVDSVAMRAALALC